MHGSRDAAPARRPEDRGNRQGLPRARSDDRAAHCPREEAACEGGAALRGAGRPRATSVWRRCWRSSTWCSTRAMRHRGRRLATPGAREEAMRLGRVIAALPPDDPEVHGLEALMELQASRLRARGGAGGEMILRRTESGRWDHLLIRRGLAPSARQSCRRWRGSSRSRPASRPAMRERGHRRRPTGCGLRSQYAQLADIGPSPFVRLNHAVAIGMAFGPAAALALVDALTAQGPVLASYHYVPSVRGDLLEKHRTPRRGARRVRLGRRDGTQRPRPRRPARPCTGAGSRGPGTG